MKKVFVFRRSLLSGFLTLFALAVIIPACQKLHDILPHHNNDPKVISGNFNQVNLVASAASYQAKRVDPLLVNGWGISWSGGGTAWLASQGKGVSTVYDREGAQQLAAVSIPSPGGPTGGNPTGTVFNGSATDYILPNGSAGRFLFVGLDGVISGWNGGTAAQLVKNNSATAVYTGLAIANDGGASFLYAANFRTRTIDVFDRTFTAVTSKPFVDPYLPAGYSPFNIQLVGDKLYVAYAKVGSDGKDLKGKGNGVVNVFSTGGVLLKRFADKGTLNSPWGVAQAPASFFPGTNGQPAILIGNFGDGRINAYATDGKFLGQLQVKDKIVEIEGLWAISFAPSTSTIDPNRLYFAAGPNEEKDGLFGYILK